MEIAEETTIETTKEERRLYGNVFYVAPGVWRFKDLFVNMFLIENPEENTFILVDTGLKSSAAGIRKMVTQVTHPESRPSAIILTHGHFDHRGSLEELVKDWQVPVYAHHMERPYLTGKASYPPADPSSSDGMMACMAFLYPKKPIDVSDHLKDLPSNGLINELPDWQWIHTPGHAPGHISLFRKADKVLIAGDAVVTTKQEYMTAVITQMKKLCGPPKYFTPDWDNAAQSVKILSDLDPNIIASGHGCSMYGPEAREALKHLNLHFKEEAVPKSGRYVGRSALFGNEGPIYIPPARGGVSNGIKGLVAVTAFVVAGLWAYSKVKNREV